MTSRQRKRQRQKERVAHKRQLLKVRPCFAVFIWCMCAPAHAPEDAWLRMLLACHPTRVQTRVQ